MIRSILYFHYDPIDDKSFGSDSGALGALCQERSRGLDRFESRRVASPAGRTETGLGRSGLGLTADEPESLGSGGEYGRPKGFVEQESARPAFPIDAAYRAGSRTPSGGISPAIWVEPGPLGRSDPGCTSKASVRDKVEGPAGPKLDAPVGVSSEKGKLYVSSGQRGGSQEVPSRVKKNSKIWVSGRRSFSRMRQDLPCTPVWAWAGPGKEPRFPFQP